MYRLALLIICLLFLNPLFARSSLNVMAPLLVGDIENLESSYSQSEWNKFRGQLLKVKQMGAYAITTDVWWGAVEKTPRQYDWKYYDKLASTIKEAGLKWIPILSFHQLGGNVGDEGYIPPPKWIWTKYIGEEGVKDENSLKYKSEQGNVNSEYVSAWGTPYVISDYVAFMQAFQQHFSGYANNIVEINVSLGPAGELRYPSYNSHDSGSGYPTRGALQAYSDLAVDSFRQFIKIKYGDINGLNSAWGSQLSQFNQVYPPNTDQVKNSFFQNGEHFSAYGKDFFDWYNQSLLNHGRLVLESAFSTFDSETSPFKGIEIGAKIPGIHWRVRTDRLAELSAGLIRTSYPDWYSPDYGHGYKNTIAMFSGVPRGENAAPIVLHFTCLEMDNYRDSVEVGSLAKALVFWVGQEAEKQKVTIKGENALAGELYSQRSWDNIINALEYSSYDGVTILRLGPLLSAGSSISGFRKLKHYMSNQND